MGSVVGEKFVETSDEFKAKVLRDAPPEFIEMNKRSIGRREMKLGELLLNAGKISEAEETANRALKGIYKNEPTLLLLKARIQFEQNRPGDALESLESLQEHNPDFRDAGAHLL